MSKPDDKGRSWGVATIIRQVNHYIANNDRLIENFAVSEFLGREVSKDDYGQFGIIKVEILQNDLIGLNNYTKIRMRLNDKNDCVIYSIFNSIKNTPGFKKYSIDKIKGEFKTIKVKIDTWDLF